VTEIKNAHINPFIMVENILDSDYEAIRGFPHPGCRIFFGINANYSSLELISTIHSRRFNKVFSANQQKFTIILFLASLLVSCAGEGTHHMTQDQLLTAIQKEAAPVIVDVRSQNEYESGHVPSALHLPFYAMWSRHAEMKAKFEDPIILYCEHGPRAGIAKFALWTLGYTNIAYLDGHMSAWKQGDLPLEKNSMETYK
jgi:prepilin-type processing-associated H-X9-DG protein